MVSGIRTSLRDVTSRCCLDLLCRTREQEREAGNVTCSCFSPAKPVHIDQYSLDSCTCQRPPLPFLQADLKPNPAVQSLRLFLRSDPHVLILVAASPDMNGICSCQRKDTYPDKDHAVKDSGMTQCSMERCKELGIFKTMWQKLHGLCLQQIHNLAGLRPTDIINLNIPYQEDLMVNLERYFIIGKCRQKQCQCDASVFTGIFKMKWPG